MSGKAFRMENSTYKVQRKVKMRKWQSFFKKKTEKSNECSIK